MSVGTCATHARDLEGSCRATAQAVGRRITEMCPNVTNHVYVLKSFPKAKMMKQSLRKVRQLQSRLHILLPYGFSLCVICGWLTSRAPLPNLHLTVPSPLPPHPAGAPRGARSAVSTVLPVCTRSAACTQCAVTLGRCVKQRLTRPPPAPPQPRLRHAALRTGPAGQHHHRPGVQED